MKKHYLILLFIFINLLSIQSSFAQVNIALNKLTAVSSIEGAGVEGPKAVDGNTSTRWASNATVAQYIYVDLGSVSSVTAVTLRWEAGTAAYQLQSSNDASSWTTFYSGSSGNGQTQALTGFNVSARYIRMNSTGAHQGTAGVSLYEFEIYSPNAFSLSATSKAFGNVPVSTSKQDSVTVTNNGGSTITISSVTSSDGNFTVTPTSGSVNAAGTMKFYITFQPTSQGAKSGTITFTHNAAGSPSTVSVTGTGITPTFSVAPTSVSFGNIATNSSKIDSVTVTNTGAAPLIISNVTSDNAQFTVTPTTGTIVTSGTQKFYFTFLPATAGAKSGTISFTDNATGSPHTVSVSGTGVDPTFILSSSSINFGNVLKSTSKQDSVIVTNTGVSSISVTNVTSNNAKFTVTPTSATITAGATKSFYVTFSPADTSTQNANITFTHNTIGSPTVVTVTGKGIAPQISIAPTTLSYGSVAYPQSKMDSVTVTNAGTATLTVTSVTSNDATFTVSPTSGNVTAGGTMKFYITFTPVASGAKNATITFNHNVSGTAAVTVAVSATGLVAGFSPSAATKAFGNTATNSSKIDSVTITNNGTAPLTISNVTSDNAEFTVTPTSGSIATGGTQKYYITFLPISVGAKNGTITFTDNALGSPHTVTVSGTGVAPTFILSSSTINFGNVLKNSSKQDSIIVTNTGASSISVTNVTSNNAKFTVTPTTATIIAGGTKSFYVTFSPADTSTQNANITFTHNTISSPTVVAVTGKGIAPQISITPLTLPLGNVTYPASKTDSVTVTNAGTATLTVSSVTSNDATFTVSPTSGNISANGGTMKFYITFTPVALGAKNATITFNHNVSGTAAVTVATSGTGLVPGFSLSANTKSFGNVKPAANKKDSVIVTNNGTATLNISSVTSNNAKYVVTPTSGAINSAGTLKFYITYTPATLTNDTAKITFIHGAPGSPGIVTATGTGYGAVLSVSTTSMFFGDVAPTVAKKDSLVFTNSGNAICSLYTITSSVADFAVTPAGVGVVNPNSTKKYYVTFTPTAVGSKNGTITFTHNAPNTPTSVVVSGRGAAPQMTNSKSSIAFNALTVGETQIDSFIITNTGNLRLKITGMTSNSNQFIVAAANDSIEPNSTKKYYVTFAPTSIGSKTGSISITHNAVGSPNTISLTGSAGAPIFGVSPGTLNLGTITTFRTSMDSVTVTNTGTASLKISAVTANNAAFTITPTSAIIPNGANNTKKFYITFAPAGVGNASGTISFAYNIAGSPSTVQVSGNAIASPGNMVDFNGTTSYVEVANTASLQLTSALTLEAWVYPKKLSQSAGIISKSQATSPTGYYMSLGAVAPFSSIVVSGVETPTGKIQEGKWHHIAAVISGTSVSIYINGSLVKTGTMASALTAATDVLRFGVHLGNKYFNGAIDEMRIWNVARTQSQIQSCMNLALKGNEQGLVAYYRLDELNGATVANTTGNLTGTLTGGATLISSDAPVESATLQSSTRLIQFGLTKVSTTKSENVTLSNIGTRDLIISSIASDNSICTISPSSGTIPANGSLNITISYSPTSTIEDSANIIITHNAPRSPYKISIKGSGYEASSQNNTNLSSISFNGTDSTKGFVQGSANVNTPSQITVASWINLSNSGSTKNAGIIELGNNVKLRITPDKNLLLTLLKTNNDVVDLSVAYSLAGWHHVAAVISYGVPTQVKLFIDGREVKSKAITVLFSPPTLTPDITIGSAFKGYIDEVSVWQQALDAAKIIEIMNYSSATLSSAKANLLAYYPLSETDSARIYDSSGNARNGMLLGAYTRLPFGAPLGVPLLRTAGGELQSYNFGNISTGQSVSVSATIVNTGNLPLRISSLAASDADVAVSSADTSAVVPGGTRALTVTFSPTQNKDYSTTISISDNAERTPHSFVINGRGYGSTTLTTDASLVFGNVAYGIPTVKKITITNSGTAPAYILNAVEQYTGSPYFTCSPTTLTIAAGQTDSIMVTFIPDAKEYSAAFYKVVITTLNAGTKEIPVSGKGIYAGTLTVQQKAIDFGNAAAFVARKDSAKMFNTGSGVVTITGYTSTGNDVAITGPAQIAGGDSVKIFIAFKPKGVGVRSGKVYITYLKAGTSGASVAAIDSSISFTGTGVFSRLTNADNAIRNGINATLIDANRLRFDTAFTYEAWVKPRNTATSYNAPSTLINNKGGFSIQLVPQSLSIKIATDTNSTTTYVHSGYSVKVHLNNAIPDAEFGNRAVNDVFEYYPYGKGAYSYYTYSSGGYNAVSWQNGYHQEGYYTYAYSDGVRHSAWYSQNTITGGGYSSYSYSSSSSYLVYVGYTRNTVGTSGKIPDDVWSHIAVTWKKGDSLRVYKNGNLIGVTSGGVENILYTNPNAVITSLADGDMDEVLLWNYARTQDQIIHSYAEGIGNSDGLSAYWKFAEGTGRTIGDASGNANTLTLDNANNWAASTLPVTLPALADSVVFDFGNMNSISTTPISQTIRLFKKSDSTSVLPLRAVMSDSTNFKIVTPIIGVGEFGDDITVSFTASSEGSKSAILNLYNASTNDYMGKVFLQGNGIRPKISGKISQTSYYSSYSSYYSSYTNYYYYYGAMNYNTGKQDFSNSVSWGSYYSYSSSTSKSTSCYNYPFVVTLRDTNEHDIMTDSALCNFEFNDLLPGKYFLYTPGIDGYYVNYGYAYYYFSGFREGYFGAAEVTTDKVNFSGFDVDLFYSQSISYSYFKSKSKNKTNTVLEWTDPLTWGSQLPNDTCSIALVYPGLYNQISINLNLTELNNYCNTHTCDGADVTSLKSLTIVDSAKLTVTGSGAWNIKGILSVNGDLTIDADSTATITIDELQVGGSLTIPEGKNPTIILNGGFVCSGTFNPGNATIIMNSGNLNFLAAPTPPLDSVKRTLNIYNLVLNSDSTLIADNVNILNQLTLNADVRIANTIDEQFDAVDTLFIASPSPNAIVGNGSIKSGFIKHAIDQSEPGTYRFHTPGTIVHLTSTNNLPSSLTVMRLLGTVPNSQYLAVKQGTVDNNVKSVSTTNVNPVGHWGFGTTTYQNGDVRGGPFYAITAQGSQEMTGDISLGYDVSLLNGLDESSLALLKVSTGIHIHNLVDVDGNPETDSDRVLNNWEVKIYKDSVTESNLISTQTGTDIVLDDVKSGTYIIVPNTDTHFRTIGRTINGRLYSDSLEEMKITIPEGLLMYISATRVNVVTVNAESGLNGTIIPSGESKVFANGKIEYNIVPDFGYRIDQVLVDGVPSGNNNIYTFDGITEDHEITVTFVIDDNVLFRTFAANTDIAKKGTKLVYKKQKDKSVTLTAPPNLATAIEATFKKIGKTGAPFLGIKQTSKTDLKQYGFILYKSAADLGKFFTSAHTANYYPIDSIRAGKKSKKIVGLVKADRKIYNNIAWEQGVALHLNLLASLDSITPVNLGLLTIDTSIMLAGKDVKGMMLEDFADYYDTLMTYWKDRGIDDDTAYGELKNVVEGLIRPINDGFYAPISSTNHTVGTEAQVKKNAYAVTLAGVKRASDIRVLKLVPGKRSTRHFATTGDELPTVYHLYQNYPNPFNPTTTIRFALPNASVVSLKIYNILGQQVTTLLNKVDFEAGEQEVLFDASNFATGVYFYRLDVNNGEYVKAKKLLLLK